MDRGASRGLDVALVGVLMLSYAAAYAYVTALTDTARDVGVGWRIATGAEFPLYGPHIGGRWRLGPVWFYGLAPLVAAARSMTTVALGVGLVAALKFPFAYLLGRRLAGRSCALAWVALLALPGLGYLEQAVFSHFNLVGAAVLGTLLAAHRAWQAPSALRWAVLGLAFSLAIHAHPTAIVIAPVLPLVWWSAGEGRPRAALAIVAAGLLPLVPMLIGEARSGFAQAGATAEFVELGGFGERLAQAPGLLGVFAHNDLRMTAALLAPLGPAGGVLVALSALALAVGLAAALTLPMSVPLRVRWLVSAYLAAALAGLSALRHPASVYFFYAALPLGNGLAALGWTALAQRFTPARRELPGLALTALALLASAALLAARHSAWREGWQRIPGVMFGHVGATPDPTALPGDMLPMFALDAIGRAACDAPDGLTLHGDAGTLLELAQALPVWLGCGPQQNLRVGGPGPALAGYPVGLWRAAGIELPAGASGYIWFRALEAFDSGGQRVFLHEQYPPYVWRPKPKQTWSVDTHAAAGDWIAVTNLNPQLVRVRAPELVLDGEPVQAAAQSRNTWLFALERAGPLRVQVTTDDPSWLDVVRLRAEEARARP